MSSLMVANAYGSAKVNLLKLIRPSDANNNTSSSSSFHSLHMLSTSVELKGDFASVYLQGDNTNIVPTDSIKNIIYSAAYEYDGCCGVGKENNNETSPFSSSSSENNSDLFSIEGFAQHIGKYLLQRYAQITSCHVEIEEELYDHVDVKSILPGGNSLSAATGGAASSSSSSSANLGSLSTNASSSLFLYAGTTSGLHPFSFTTRQGGERRATVVDLCRGGTTTVESRIMNLHLVRTAGAEFRNFHRDEMTTMPNITDRVLSTTVDLRYRFFGSPEETTVDFNGIYSEVRKAVIRVFSDTTKKSLALQQTALAICKEVIRVTEEVKEAHIEMPNKNFLIAPNLKTLNPNNNKGSNNSTTTTIYAPQDIPHGIVKCTAKRHHVEIPVPFQWNKTFDVKDQLLNKQHSDLFDLIRELDGNRHNTKLLVAILEHAKQHFHDEEAIFDKEGYDKNKSAIHKRVHASFVTKALKATNDGKGPVNDGIILFLKKWLVEHIMGPDMQYARFLERRGHSSKL